MTSSTDADLRTLSDLTVTSEDGAYTLATPCVRADFLCEGPISGRPGKIDEILTRAAEIMDGEFTFYGSEGPWSLSKKRKPKEADVAQLADTTRLLKAEEDKRRGEQQAVMEDLRKRGQEPDPANFIARDGGTLCLSDKFPMGQSGSHIQLLGFSDWRISLSFSGALFAKERPRILSLIEDLFASGLPETGSFGFAMNSQLEVDGHARESLLPLTRRFRLLSPIQAGTLKWTNIWDGRKGLYPINSWTYHDKALLAAHRITEGRMRALAKDVHEVRETDHGFLIKLYAEPSLGDVNADADLGPAHALGAVLGPAMQSAELSGLIGIRVGPSADRWSHYLRFARPA